MPLLMLGKHRKALSYLGVNTNGKTGRQINSTPTMSITNMV